MTNCSHNSTISEYNESEILNKQNISIKQKSFSDNLVVEENSMHQVQEVHSEGIQRRKYSCENVNSSRKRSVSINLPIQRRMSTNEQQSEETSYNSYTEMNSDISTGVNCRQIDKVTLNNGCHEPYVDVCKSIHGNRLARVTEVNESDFDTSDDRSLSDDDDDEDIDTDTEDDSDDSSESDSFVDHSQLSNMSNDLHEGEISKFNERNEDDDDDDDTGALRNDVIKQSICTNQLGNTQFLRLEKMRADLEEELGFELLLKAYNVIQALQEDEDETITESEQIVTSVLGEEKTRIYYDRIVQLVLADGVYMDDE
ncbi:Serine/threonine-protein kinase Nek1 [Schistosoma japonicum]|nr:Serine/threonine-protein kinase Nek1 [Schistosoma japonicum]KAH8869788.1 Serine/threonine-protein kinase Nek1 [Schistosoma japonicum]